MNTRLDVLGRRGAREVLKPSKLKCARALHQWKQFCRKRMGMSPQSRELLVY